MTVQPWPETLPARQVRIARPTDQLEAVLCFDNEVQVDRVAARLAARGYPSVEAENPYWPHNGGVTIEDPDRWRVVLMPRPSFAAANQAVSCGSSDGTV